MKIYFSYPRSEHGFVADLAEVLGYLIEHRTMNIN